ncbi:SACS-like protein [Mya arenaria]|uniref:SACS-like protein n=1 Tax=Mya arenaria TaxID=6604 RepID=A0ABY7EPI2_MYAAR|nr:SACS-like protein [Mya arenaria]
MECLKTIRASTSDGRRKGKRKSTSQDMDKDVVKKKKPVYSGFKQPTLIEQLKYILAEYPDGGQILKELIQNAEDAGARTMGILLDERRLNRTDETSPAQYKKFFQIILA